jgi:hypothetical protein
MPMPLVCHVGMGSMERLARWFVVWVWVAGKGLRDARQDATQGAAIQYQNRRGCWPQAGPGPDWPADSVSAPPSQNHLVHIKPSNSPCAHPTCFPSSSSLRLFSFVPCHASRSRASNPLHPIKPRSCARTTPLGEPSTHIV